MQFRLFTLSLATAFMAGISILFPSVFLKTEAATNVSLYGYAWSDNVGWISMNCENTGSCGTSNHNVSFDGQSGNLSGYAWSDNIGWVSFNSSDTSGCPQAPCTPKLDKTSGAASGWIKALAGGSGGWDGWIKLSGVVRSGTSFSGYAWGSDVVGWVDWSRVTSGQVCSPLEGQACSTSPNSCGEVNWGTYQCDGSCSAQFPPAEVPGYGNLCLSDANSCKLRNRGTITCSSTCSATAPATCNLNACVSITADPELTGQSGMSALSWSANCGVGQACTVYNGDTGQIISNETSGASQVGPISSVTTFAMTCDVGPNTFYGSTTVSPSNARDGIYREF